MRTSDRAALAYGSLSCVWFALMVADWTVLLMEMHAFTGCIPLVECFLFKRCSLTGQFTDKFSPLRRQYDLSPMPQSRLILLAKSDILRTGHGVHVTHCYASPCAAARCGPHVGRKCRELDSDWFQKISDAIPIPVLSFLSVFTMARLGDRLAQQFVLRFRVPPQLIQERVRI
jgi:hypothetical protein